MKKLSIVEKNVWERIFDKNNSNFEIDFNNVLMTYLDYAEKHICDEHSSNKQDERREVIEAVKKRTSDPNWIAELRVTRGSNLSEQHSERFGKFWETLFCAGIAGDLVDIYQGDSEIKKKMSDFYFRIYEKQKSREDQIKGPGMLSQITGASIIGKIKSLVMPRKNKDNVLKNINKEDDDGEYGSGH